MIRSAIQLTALFVSFLLLGKARTLRICKEIEEGYVEEIDRMRSRQMKLIFHKATIR